ncbi:MAG: pyridoxal phosphate-dependent aminotransferase [Rhodospirillales bacterium]
MALRPSRRSSIAPFIVMDVMRAATARDRAVADPADRTVHLEIGQPGGAAPGPVLDAAARALRSDRLGYTDAFGLPELRAQISARYRAAYGVDVAPERIVVTTGSSGAFVLGFLAAFDVGARVALADPGYPAYRNILSALGVEVVGLPTGAQDRYQPTIERLEAAGRLDGLIVASPANPTGTMLPAGELAALAAWCRSRGVRLVSDEIYHGIVYGPPATTLAGDGDAIVVNSFSKYFAMTGWRLGWMVVPPDLLRAVEVLAQNLFISPPSLPQHAALAAFDCCAELDARVAGYRANRDLLLAELPKAGFSEFAPADGAFYLYCDVGRLTNDSAAFCRQMLDQAGVAATPGTDFDPGRGNRFVRFSFAGGRADMELAVSRLQRWRAGR